MQSYIEKVAQYLAVVYITERLLRQLKMHTFAAINLCRICFHYTQLVSRQSFFKYEDDTARTYLQPHYCNGVFRNVYLSARQH